MRSFFSIIIPVYNVAPYLRECLDSVLAQTFADWEAICVDDGSTDGSNVILDEYVARDSRFRVIHQPNAGVSAARNRALDEIKGEWFTFLDGDDVLRKDGLALFVPHLIDNGCDGILIQPYIPYWNGKGIPERKTSARTLKENAEKEDLIYGQHAANGFVISRIYRTGVFGRLRFVTGIKMAEDVRFWFDALCLPAKWTVMNAEYYLYRQRGDSVCGLKNPKDCEAVLDSVLYAFGRIAGPIGLGAEGRSRYLARWPYSPANYLRIFIHRRGELDSAARVRIFSKYDAIVEQAGIAPFPLSVKCELALVRRGLGFLVPAVDAVSMARLVAGRAWRILKHVCRH